MQPQQSYQSGSSTKIWTVDDHSDESHQRISGRLELKLKEVRNLPMSINNSKLQGKSIKLPSPTVCITTDTNVTVGTSRKIESSLDPYYDENFECEIENCVVIFFTILSCHTKVIAHGTLFVDQIPKTVTCDVIEVVLSPKGKLLMNAVLCPADEKCSTGDSQKSERQEGVRKKINFRFGHSFITTYLSQPTYCSLCRDFIWGVVKKQGLSCSLCKCVIHIRCLSKVVAQCSRSNVKTQKGLTMSPKNHTFTDTGLPKLKYCGHCGKIIHIMSGNVIKCTECASYYHEKCKENILADCGFFHEINAAENEECGDSEESETCAHASSNSINHRSKSVLGKASLSFSENFKWGNLTKSKSLQQKNPISKKISCKSLVKKMDSANVDAFSEDYRQLDTSAMEMSVENFTFVSFIGRGCYADVLLVQHATSSKYFALKTFKQDKYYPMEEFNYLMKELMSLSYLRHNLVSRFYASFCCSVNLYLVMEYVPGGDLYFHIRKTGGFDETQTLFYAVEIIRAIEYLHSIGILHRDVKCENIMIASDGHIKLTDFGSACNKISCTNLARTFCGTPEYMAPDILLTQETSAGYGFAVDIWSLGICIFEMLSAEVPFKPEETNNVESLFENIKTQEVTYPDKFSPSIIKLLSAMLEKDPEKRCGLKNDGASFDIKSIEVFSNVKWNSDFEDDHDIIPPIIPNLTSTEELANFKESVVSTPVNSVFQKPKNSKKCTVDQTKSFSIILKKNINDWNITNKILVNLLFK